jgi:hypothetical protein
MNYLANVHQASGLGASPIETVETVWTGVRPAQPRDESRGYELVETQTRQLVGIRGKRGVGPVSNS